MRYLIETFSQIAVRPFIVKQFRVARNLCCYEQKKYIKF